MEGREERLEKLGNCHGFPRAGNPLSAVEVFPVGLPAARDTAVQVPFIDSKMKMLSLVHECICGGAQAGPPCPRH